MSTNIEKFSIWIEPEGFVAEDLTRLIEKYTSMTGQPFFKPHVTLSPGFEGKREDIRRRFGEFFSTQKSFPTFFTHISFKDLYFKSAFIECEKSSELMGCNRLVQKLFSQTYDYEPHLSLVYGTVDLVLKGVIGKDLEIKKPSSFNFTAKKISLWYTPGDVPTWEKIDETILP